MNGPMPGACGHARRAMTIAWRCGRRAPLAVALAAVALAAGPLALPHAEASVAAKRVLIVHSFEREVAPFDAVTSTFRRELATQATEPIAFLEASLGTGREIGGNEAATFLGYLKSRFNDPAPDLIVSIGSPAAQFLLRHREALFPGVPIVVTALDARFAPQVSLKPGDALVSTRLDLPRVLDTLTQVLPQTRTIAVIIGNSAFERMWRNELRRDTASLAQRVEFVWLDGLPLQDIKARVAALPTHSAVFYGLLMLDAAGVPHERLEALAELKQVANAPIFSAFESELGQGVVGGPYVAQSRAGREAARAAWRSLSAPGVGEPLIVTIDMEPPAYDWRELQRWQVDESRLPAGSELRYRPLPAWVEHRDQFVVAGVVIVAQALLIGALLVQRAQRRRAESESRTLGGRLITAYEDEGRRLARELHDDITQRLAGVSIEAAMLSRVAEPAARSAAEQSVVGELAQLSRDVHALAYRLHPSVIDDLGLGEALRIECERAARRSAIDVRFEGDAERCGARGDRALCLFRVAQEALRNAVRHAEASHIRVELRPDLAGTRLTVADDGVGFDLLAAQEHASLGLASMRERVALLRGRFEIRSRRGQGTTVTAWVPDSEAG